MERVEIKCALFGDVKKSSKLQIPIITKD